MARAVLSLSLGSLLVVACAAPRPDTTVPAPTVAVVPPAPAPVPPAASPTVAGPPTAKATPVRTVEGITEYRLGNGLQVLLFPDPTQSTVTVNITYLVGSRLEGYGETGMAHLLEHMMFKGSPRHRNVMKLVEARGGELNGSTWTDRTNYFETLPASQDNLDWALELESDRMLNASISPDDLKTEFSVVRNEFEMDENNTVAMLQERIVSTAYLWHNYGKDTIGSKSDIERVPVPALRAFYEKYYQPDNAVLIVAGKFDDGAALASIERQFGALPRPTRQLAPSYTVEPVQDGERTVTLRRNGELFAVAAAYHTVGAASPDYPAVLAAIDLLTREPSGRLYKKLIETKLASSIDGGQEKFRDPYVAMVTAEVREPKNVDKVEQTLLAELEGLGASKIDDKDVERWRAATIKDLELAFANSRQIAVELSEFAALGDWRTWFAYRDQVAKTTAADIQRVARAYFKQSNRTSGRFIPTKDADRAPLTETPDVATIVKGIEGGEVKDKGEAFEATLDNIEHRTARSELKCGIKAALLPKKTRGGKVALELDFHWGDDKSLQGKATVAELTAELLARGTKHKTFQELQDLQDQLKSHITITGGADGFGLRIQGMRDHLPAALDLAAEMLTAPSFPAAQLELIKQEQLAYLQQQLQDPTAVAWATLAELSNPWPKGDPRHPLTPTEKIAAVRQVTLADVQAFYKEFAGAGHGELVVLGDFDAAAIGGQVEQRFAGWTSKKPYARLQDKPFDGPGVAKTITIKDKEMTQLVGSQSLAMKDTDPDYPAWLMVGQILGGDAGSRLWMRLREREGLSYGPYGSTFAGSLDDAGGLEVEAIVAPQNLAKAKALMLDEIGKLATGTVTAEELARAKDAWLKRLDTDLSSDGYVVSMLRSELYRERTTEFTKALRAKVQAVTAADVERAAKKYVHPDKIVVVDAGDTSKP